MAIKISCLMPTNNRREFIPRAISCFQMQQYPADWDVELVILDDGSDPIKDLVLDDPRIKYFHETPPQNHGTKMNRCCDLAQGEYCVVFDDDDWYAHDRIYRLVQPMIRNPTIHLTGSRTLFYYQHGENKAYQYTSPQGVDWLSAIAFRKSTWAEHKFDMISAGSDYNLQRKLPQGSKLDLNDPHLVVASVHSNNACRKTLSSGYTPIDWKIIERLWQTT